MEEIRKAREMILDIPVANSPGSVIGHYAAVIRGRLPGFFISPEEVSGAIGEDSVALALRMEDGRPSKERYQELQSAFGEYINNVLGIGGTNCSRLDLLISDTRDVQGGEYKGMHTDGKFLGPSAHLDGSPIDATRIVRLMTVSRNLGGHIPEDEERDASKGDGPIHERAQRTGGLTVFCGGEITVAGKTLKTAHRFSGSGLWARFGTSDNTLRNQSP